VAANDDRSGSLDRRPTARQPCFPERLWYIRWSKGMRSKPGKACRLWRKSHLLRAGVDINTIRAWLGHVSIDTTNVYAEVDLEMKAKALAACDRGGKGHEIKMWRKNPRVMEFLRIL